MENPSQKLALQILNKLIDEGILSESDRVQFSTKLAEGTITSDDWRLAIELTMDKKGD